jgi:ribosome-associated protein
VTATTESVVLAQAAAAAASDKLAEDIVAFDVSEVLAIADIFLVCSASSERQVGAIVDAVEERLREFGAKPVHREGERDHRWVLLDYLDVVIHVQHDEERAFYALERLWRDCPVVELALDAAPAAKAQS